ncbi:MAG: ParB/RepB/Spo0J family partition protein [Clostridia bacterium]|nr:ParB/RepB/Spo0J family partition protein [Clostridia bacterium]
MRIDKVNINNLIPFNENPYRIREGEELESLLDSISENGIISPLVVRPTDEKGKFEVISGHRRLHAARMLDLETVPVTVCDVSREEAAIMLVDSNLHREHILPSEKAMAYKLKLDAIKAQGKRTDLTCGQAVHKSRESVSDADSGRQVQRYIRLTMLIPELLTMVDENKIAFSVAVELSYLDKNTQRMLLGEIEETECTPSYSQANRIRKLFQLGELNENLIKTIMNEEKANQKPMFKMSMERLLKYSPKSDERQMQEFIIKACEYYAKYLQKKRNREAR